MPICERSLVTTVRTVQLRLDRGQCDNGAVKSTLIAAAPMAAVLVWLTAIMVDPGPYTPTSVLLIGFGWLLLSTVSTVGLVLVGGRWALYTLLVTLSTTFGVATLAPLNGWTVAGLSTSSAALILLLSPRQERLVRKLPSASGPPPRSVVVTIGALGLPLALGLIPTNPNSWVLLMAACGPISAFLYSRTIPGGLASMRFGLMTAALLASAFMTLPHSLTVLVICASITVIAWSPDVAVAFRPLIEKGSTYAIPPELAPKEILKGAGIDERGRPV